MKNYIVINANIYESFKDEILPLNARLFTTPYFYNLKDYKEPLDLKGIENYLSFCDEIVIYTSTTLIDYINILLVLSFLRKNQYSKKVSVKYINLNEKKFEKANFLNVNLTSFEYNDVDFLLLLIKSNKNIKDNLVNLPGSNNFINFLNMINNKEKFIMMLEDVIEEYDENIDNIASYLNDKYSNFGLSKEFYLTYLRKCMGESDV